MDMINWLHLLLKGLSAGEDESAVLEGMKKTGALRAFIQQCKTEAIREEALINLEELMALRAQYLTEMLTHGNRCYSKIFAKYFMSLKFDENVKQILHEMIGEEKAKEMMNLDYHHYDEGK
jgi:hypothetical protein